MRSVTFRYPNQESLERDLGRADPALPLPPDQRADDGEWVLAVLKVTGPEPRATAIAARVEARHGGFAIVFERRDWERLAVELGGAPGPVSVPRPAESSASLAGPRSKRGRAAQEKNDKAHDKPGPSQKVPSTGRNASAKSAPSSRRGKNKQVARTMPPPSRSGTVLTRTLIPPSVAEIHEADAPDHTLEAPVGRPSPSWRPPRVLLVDDDRDLQTLIREMLDAIQIDVDCAANAEEALDRLALEHFDIIILDWTLPGMSGIELCRELRRDPRLREIPILFLTGRSAPRDLVDAFAAGADDFVAKPFRAPELGARLFALLRRAKVTLSIPP